MTALKTLQLIYSNFSGFAVNLLIALMGIIIITGDKDFIVLIGKTVHWNVKSQNMSCELPKDYVIVTDLQSFQFCADQSWKDACIRSKKMKINCDFLRMSIK